MKDIELLTVTFDKGPTLMQALEKRKSTKIYQDKELTLEHLSGVMWAAGGFNRKETSNLVNPTARNIQNISIHAALSDGIYFYNNKKHSLEWVKAGDRRKDMTNNEYAITAPLNLVFSVDYSMDREIPAGMARHYARLNVGYISQSVYLYASAFGLGSVARGNIDYIKIAQLLELKPEAEVILAQTVGYPK